MALDLPGIQDFLVDQCQSHLTVCGWSLERQAANPDLRVPIWVGLQTYGVTITLGSDLSTFDFSVIAVAGESRFLTACRIALKRKVLEHYLSQVTQAGLDERKDFDKRARLLKEDLDSEIQAYADLAAQAVQDGAYGGPLSERTNVPDAVCIPYHS